MPILLNARLSPPVAVKNFIIRQQLVDQLMTAADFRLTFLEAAAGSGKTSVMGHFYRQLASDARGWLTISSECNQPVIFWSYLLEMLAPKLAQSDENWASFLQFAALPENHLQDFVYRLCNELQATTTYYLFLDDFHLLTDSVVLATFQLFLENVSTSVHFVIGSRYELPFSLGSLSLRQKVQWLRKSAFYLTESEAQQFLRETLSKKWSEEQEKELIQMAGGWIGGLQLLSAVDEDTRAQIKGNPLAVDYIANEIFNNFSAELQNFLMVTGAFPYFFPLLVEKLQLVTDFKATLHTLTEQNFLFQCLNETAEMYQYHPLIQDFLQEKFKEQSQSRQRQQFKVAAATFEAFGDSETALAFYQNVEDFGAMISLLGREPKALRYTEYYCRIPVAAAIQQLDFLYQKFFHHYLILDYATCHEILSLVEGSGIPEKAAMEDIHMLLDRRWFLTEDPPLSIKAVQQLKLDDNSKAILLIKSAVISSFRDDYGDALALLEESLRLGQKQRNFSLILTSQMCYGQVLEELGHLKASERLLEQIQQQFETQISAPQILTSHQLTYAMTSIGVYLKQGNFEAAESALAQVASLSQELVQEVAFAYEYNQCEYYFLTGEESAASNLLEKLAVENPGNLLNLAPLFRYGFLQNRVPLFVAESYAAECLRQKVPLLMNQKLAFCLYQWRQGAAAAAEKGLKELQMTARKKKIPLKIVETNLLMLAVQGEQPSVDLEFLMTLYQEALYYAARYEIKAPFYGQRSNLLAFYGKSEKALSESLKGPEATFHRGLVNQWQLSEIHLTQREREVLVLLAQGFTNKEISQALFISVATVKSHVLSIYRKLAVNSRVLAVEMARSLGLLD